MTDEELIARLREDVFYGDDRLHNLSRRNPLHMEAADRIKDLVERNKELALQLLATQGQVADRIKALIAERDHWSGVARREGVCMTCRGPYGAPQPYGCSDCLNTGYCGEHHSTVADLEAKLAKAVEALEYYAVEAMPWEADDSLIARATLAEIKGESHE